MSTTNRYQAFIVAVTGEHSARALCEIERLMQAMVLHGSLELCSRDALMRCAQVAAAQWRARPAH